MPAQASDTGDRDLVHQSILGSREAFGLLVVRYSRSVRATCLARVGRSNDLDDLVQEAFLRAFRGLSRLEDPTRFGPYVHRIAQNVCVDRLRRGGHEPEAVAEVELLQPAVREAVADVREERLERLRQHVGRMPMLLREVVLLHYFDHRTTAEIASMLSATEAAVNQRLHRARQHLKQAFADGGPT